MNKLTTLATLNIGLLVEKTGREISREEVTQALVDCAVEPVISLLYEGQWEGKPQPTLVVLGEIPTNWSGEALADLLEQDAIAVLEHDTDDGVLYGPNPNGWQFDLAEFITVEKAAHNLGL